MTNHSITPVIFVYSQFFTFYKKIYFFIELIYNSIRYNSASADKEEINYGIA